MRHKICFLILISLALFCYTDLVWAGWVVTYAETETGEETKEYYQDGKANFGALIYDGRDFMLINHESQGYWQGSPDQYCNAVKRQSQLMEQQLASLPEQYRPKAMGSKKITRQKVGTEIIAGFKASGYDFYVDGARQGRIWVSNDSGLGELIRFENNQQGKMNCFAEMESMSLEGTKVYKETVRNGFVLKESYRAVVSVKRATVSGDHFKSPAGYRAFTDYQQFMNHATSQARSAPSSAPSPFYQDEETAQGDNRQDGVDSYRAAQPERGGAVNQARAEPPARNKNIPRDIQEEVGGFLKKIF